MAKNIIKINEAELCRIVNECVRKILNEGKFASAVGVPEKFHDSYLKKMIADYPDLDPDGFYWKGNTLQHTGERKKKKSSSAHSGPKTAKPEKIVKPENMSDEEYYQTMVLPQNSKIRVEAEKYDDEVWRPVVNGGRYFGGEADYSKSYAVSNHGRLRILNYGNPNKSRIVNPYPAPTRKAMQFHLNGADETGNAMLTCPSVSYMVANAFLGEHYPKLWKVIHKDGDWTNNNVENLEWVQKH